MSWSRAPYIRFRIRQKGITPRQNLSTPFRREGMCRGRVLCTITQRTSSLFHILYRPTTMYRKALPPFLKRRSSQTLKFLQGARRRLRPSRMVGEGTYVKTFMTYLLSLSYKHPSFDRTNRTTTICCNCLMRKRCSSCIGKVTCYSDVASDCHDRVMSLITRCTTHRQSLRNNVISIHPIQRTIAKRATGIVLRVLLNSDAYRRVTMPVIGYNRM